MQDQQPTAAGVAIIDLDKVTAIALDFRPKFIEDLQSVSEADLKTSVDNALKFTAPDSSDEAEIKAAIKNIDEQRKAFKQWKVQLNKTTEKWTAPFKTAQAWIKDQGGQSADLALSAEKHLEVQQNKLEAKLQNIYNERNETLCKGLVEYGLQLIPGQRMLRYAGNQTLAIDSLHKLSQDEVNAICDAQDAWVAAEEEAREKKRQQAVKIRELLAKTFKLDVVPLLQEVDAERAMEFYNTILQAYSDDYVATEADLETVSRMEFDREFAATPAPVVAQHAVVPADAVAPQEIEQPQAEEQGPEEFSAAASDEIMEVEFEEGHEFIAFSEAAPELSEAIDQRIAALAESRKQFNEIALRSRVKIGNGHRIVFDSEELLAFCKTNAVVNTHGHLVTSPEAISFNGGVLAVDFAAGPEVAEQFVARWNAMAPPRKIKS